jgi:MarR family transcriptional regulator, lower aerobic nicotinate degradation pathway regulator
LTATDTFSLEGHIGFLLRKAHQRHVAIFVEATAETGLTPTQFAALQKLDEVGTATQNLLGRLVAMDGLIARTTDPMDRRTAVLTPTDAGRSLVLTTVACARRAHEAALSPLTPDERTLLLSLLRKMG